MSAKAVNKLISNEAQLKVFIGHAPVAIAMFDCDMRYLAYSNRWLKDYGLEGRNILGRSHYEIFPEIPEHWKVFHQRGMDGETFRAEGKHAENKDGTEQWLRWDILPWHTAEDKVGGVIIYSEDLTERKKLEESTMMSNLIFQTSMEGILITDENNLIVDANPAFTKITGYALEEIKGKDPKIFQSGRHDREFYEDMWHSLLKKGHWKGEIWDNCKDGSLHISLASISMIRHADGTVYRHVAQYLDITDQLLSD